MSTEWTEAQQHEREYWEYRLKSPVGFIHDLEGCFRLAELIENTILTRKFDSVLEVGVGGYGMGLLWLFPNARRRHGVDPIAPGTPACANPFVEGLIASAQTGVEYSQCQGENLPFPEASFDLVICNNVLDHVELPMAVIEEIHRVTARGGYFALAVDVSSTVGKILRWFDRRLRPKNVSYLLHPFDFDCAQVNSMLRSAGFVVEHTSGATKLGALAGRRRRCAWICQKT